MGFRLKRVWALLPQFNPQIWILAIGRLLSHIGTGFTLFYAPIFFVNQVGLSSTAVGIGLGSAQISGILGRILGGSFSDSPNWGRRRTLLLSALISAMASLVLASANNFTTVLLGNLLAGLGIGLYWPATEAVVADLTTGKERSEAYAITRLSDNIGLQIGIVLGGILIAKTAAYRTLFLVNALSFLIFLAVIYVGLTETYSPKVSSQKTEQYWQKWRTALGDRTLLVYVAVNIVFTIYISQIHSTIPLYFNNFVQGGFSAAIISGLFTWHIALSVLSQLPIARFLNRFSRPQALMVSASLWGVGFMIIGFTGIFTDYSLALAILGLGILAMATVSYTPISATLVADLAPESRRGIYLAINAQCWAIGYLIGPPLGGWVLDQTPEVVYNFWVGLALSVALAILILRSLNQMIEKRINPRSE